jgi:hypothetical protein
MSSAARTARTNA